jgi:hypothetical protein
MATLPRAFSYIKTQPDDDLMKDGLATGKC